MLKIDWATHAAAKYACEKWHYSKSVPAGKTQKFGVWENQSFVGVVIFSGGPSPNIWKTYGLSPIEGAELSRVALREHKTPVTRIVSVAIKLFRIQCPGIKLIISYADREQGHEGVIYQAGNWIYLGEFGPKVARFYKGRHIHERNMRQRIIDGKSKRSEFTEKPVKPKHKYAIAFTDTLRMRLESESKRYPKRAPEAEATMRLSSTGEIGGSSPTSALHLKAELINGET